MDQTEDIISCFFPQDHELQKSSEKRNQSLVSKTESQGEEKNSVENILSQCHKEISLATKLKQPGLIALPGEPHMSN